MTRSGRPRSPFAAAGLAFPLLLAMALACGGAARAPQATTPPILLSPAASDVPIDLDLAGKLAHDGDFEQAIAIYTATARQRGGDTRREALSSLARLYYAQGQTAEAAQVLPLLLDSEPAPEDEARALLLLGQVELERGANAEAESSFRRYLEGVGAPADAYARVGLASVLARQGDHAGTVDQLERALAEELAPEAETDALFALARSREAAGDVAAATATYVTLTSEAATASQQADALWELAALSRRAGDNQRYQESLAALVRDYPWHPRALEALGQPQLAPAPVLTTAERAVVFFRHRENEQATAAFRAYLNEGPDAAGAGLAHYHLAILAERAGDQPAALSEYEQAMAGLAGAPDDPLFAGASFFRAQLLEALARPDEAVAAYAGLADAAPASSQAAEALFRAGLVRYQQSRPQEAAPFWSHFLDLSSEPDEAARAHFWLARAAALAADGSAEAEHLLSAADAEPWDYYGLRARALAGAEPAAEGDEGIEAIEPDWGAVEEWLGAWAGREDAAAREVFLSGLPWRRGQELALAGLSRQADDEFAAILEEVTGEPWLLYRFLRGLLELGETPLAARAASRLVRAAPDPPRDLLAVAYPSEYLDLAAESAADNGLSPLLLLALVRQESFFQPDAASFAGALGLTQVIPSTGQEIAGQMGIRDFQSSDLLRPRLSLDFGAHYLGSQLELFEGDLSAALAAYNGGPGNALRWRELAPDDPDLLLESIDLSETNLYLRLVLENYALYRYVYGLTDQPSLPLP